MGGGTARLQLFSELAELALKCGDWVALAVGRTPARSRPQPQLRQGLLQLRDAPCLVCRLHNICISLSQRT
jgi:hypothetical protein